jgi:hypothetical protein
MLTVGGYILWSATQQELLISLYGERLQGLTAAKPLEIALGRVQGMVWMLTALGLLFAPFQLFPKRPLLAMPVCGLLMAIHIRSATLYGTLFPQSGNIVDHTGYVMGYYKAAPLWSHSVWTLLGITGSLMFSLTAIAYAEQVWVWFRSRPWKLRVADPALMLYVLAVLMAGVLFLLPPFLFDRYLLPILPILMVPVLRRAKLSRFCVPLLLPLVLFALLAQRDYLAHASARWQAAEGLATEGVSRGQIDAGFEWAGWYLYAEGARRIRGTGDLTHIYFPAYAALDPVYMVTDVPQKGYAEVGSVNYTSWLSGGETRRVLVLKRQ